MNEGMPVAFFWEETGVDASVSCTHSTKQPPLSAATPTSWHTHEDMSHARDAT